MSKVNRSRFIHSKWAKTNAIIKKASLAAHIPETRKMTRSSLLAMLNKYGMVYVKPDIGTFGIGVIRVEKDAAQYRFQSGERARSFNNYDSMYSSLTKLTRRRLYLAQKGIHLLKHKNRRFDLRVMVQQSPQKRWETTGVIGRLAAPRKIVTNVHNGGKVTPIETLLSGHLSDSGKQQLVKRLRMLGESVAIQLHSQYRGLKEIGLDVALDHKIYPWILEVNTCPDPWIFRKLKDKRIFARIFRYSKAYGKF